MNKENKGQSENSDDNEMQEAPEDIIGVSEISEQDQEITEQLPEKKGGKVYPPSKSSFQAKKSKFSKPKTAADESDGNEFVEKVVAINRITKVTKGGKKLSFSALVVVGDTRGNVGYSLEKAAEVSIAIRKAIGVAKKSMVNIPMHGTTIPHEIIGQCSGSRVLLKPASDGTGVIASGPVRAVCDGAGIHNILTKCHRSNNPINVVKATFNGLTRLKPMKVNILPSLMNTDTKG